MTFITHAKPIMAFLCLIKKKQNKQKTTTHTVSPLPIEDTTVCSNSTLPSCFPASFFMLCPHGISHYSPHSPCPFNPCASTLVPLLRGPLSLTPGACKLRPYHSMKSLIATQEELLMTLLCVPITLLSFQLIYFMMMN